MYTLNRILRCVQRHVESSSVSIASLSTASNSVLLNNGQSMPTVGLGTWRTPKGQAKQIVLDAIEAGYRHFDCAYAYANEKEIGQALNEAISSGLVNRDELFIASKPWLTFFSPRRVEECLNRSLEQLGIDHVDLYIVPWPIAFRDDDKTPYPKNADRSTAFSEDIKFEDTWFGMEKVLNLGLASSIGVSNFNEKQVQHLLDNASVTPAVNQIEHHPYLTQKQLVDYCKSKGIVVTAHSPLGSPTTASKNQPSLIENEVVKRIANELSKSPAQVLVRYNVQQGITCVPKSITKSRIVENLDVFNFELTERNLADLDNLNMDHRYFTFELEGMKSHPDYPF